MNYRPNVCAVIADDNTARTLVFRRTDRVLGSARWQFPQGGIQPGETARKALLRELEEEIGTQRVEIVRTGADPVRYEYPPAVRASLAARDPEKGRYGGQAQTWFLLRLLDGESAIHFRREPREFDAYRWVSAEDAIQLVVPFKTAAYRQGLRGLGLISP